MTELKCFTYEAEAGFLRLRFADRRVRVRPGDIVFGYDLPCGCCFVPVDVSRGHDDRPPSDGRNSATPFR